MPSKSENQQKRKILNKTQNTENIAKPDVKGVFRGPRTLSVMPTFRCVANCTSCGTLSNPNDKTKLAFPTIKKCIIQAKRSNFANIVFTGGEATLCWKNLLKAIKETKKHGMMTRLSNQRSLGKNPQKNIKNYKSSKRSRIR